MAELIESFNPGWVHSKDSLIITDTFSKIIKFYIFGSPCALVTSSGQSMSQRGWSKDVWKSHELRKYLLSIANLVNDKNFKKVSTLKEMSSESTKLGLNNRFHLNHTNNRILFYNDSKSADFLMIFYYIRCAIAHGRFEIYENKNNEIIYVFEAIKKKKGSDDFIVKSRMILFEWTLLKWIEIITQGESHFLKTNEELNLRIQNEIKQIILLNPSIKKNQIANYLNYDESTIFRQFKIINEKGIVKYNYSVKKWIII